MKKNLKIKILAPVLVVLFMSTYSMVMAYAVGYDSNGGCWVSFSTAGGDKQNLMLQGTTVTFSNGGHGCLVNKAVYNVRPSSSGPDSGSGGDTGGDTNIRRVAAYFTSIYPGTGPAVVR